MIKSKVQQKLEKEEQKKLEQTEVEVYYSLQASYSIEYCNQFIKIDRNNPKKASAQKKGGFIFCETELNLNGISHIRFYVVNLFSFVYIGLAEIANFLKSEFTPNLMKTGHGGYLISNFGDCYSNDDKKLNGKRRAFQFHGDLIITMSIDYPHGTITWNNPKYKTEFKMKFNNKQTLLPVVGLRHAAVEILD